MIIKRLSALALVFCLVFTSLYICSAAEPDTTDGILPQIAFTAFYSEDDSRFEITTEIQADSVSEDAHVMAAVYKNNVFYDLLLNETINENNVYSKRITRYSIVSDTEDPNDFEFRCFTLGENLKPLLPMYRVTGEEALSNNPDMPVKLRGVVTETSVLSLKGDKDIDTSYDKTVRVDITDTYDTVNRDFPAESDGYYTGDIDEFLVGNTDIEDYLGMSVIMYVKEKTSGKYEVISVAPDTARNKIVTFPLDRFDTVDGKYIKYFKNSTDATSTKLQLSESGSNTEDAVITLNGRIMCDAADAFNSYYGIEENGKTTRGGLVTLIDNDGKQGYDVVMIDIAATAVVDTVSNETVFFKEQAVLHDSSTMSQLDVEEDDTDTVIEIVKDGEEIAYTDLTEWDVLSIIAPDADNTGYIRVEVISNQITGTITADKTSKTSGTGKAYRIDGNYYDVAECGYKTKGLSVGDSGIFYIDKYGKIAAFNGADASVGTYGYVYNTLVTDKNMDAEVQIKMITDNGVELLNFASSVNVNYKNGNKTTFKLNNISSTDLDNGDTVLYGTTKISDMRGQVIKFTKNSNGEIKTITFADYNENFESVKVTAGKYIYDAYNLKLGKYIDADSKVFFIGNAADNCSVGTPTDLSDNNTYEVLAMYADSKADDNNIIVIRGENPNAVYDDSDTNETEAAYGYVYNTLVTDKNMDAEVLVKMITDDGVELLNFASRVSVNYKSDNKTTFKVNDITSTELYNGDATLYGTTKVSDMIGQVVKFTKNSSGEIKTITFADYNENFESVKITEGAYQYYADEPRLGEIVDENSAVFFIGTAADVCSLGSLNDLENDEVYRVLAIYRADSATNNNIIVIRGENPNASYDDSNNPDVSEANAKYGYVYNTLVTDKNMDTEVLVKMITDNGVELLNFASSVNVNYKSDNKTTFKVNDVSFAELGNEDATLYGTTKVSDMIGQVVKFTKNSNGDIKTITFADYNENFGAVKITADKYQYDADNLNLGKYIDADSKIFFIGTSADKCYIGTNADLSDGNSYEVSAMYADSNADDSNIIVIKGTDSTPSASASLAIITDISAAKDENGDDVLILSYISENETVENIETIEDVVVIGADGSWLAGDLTIGDLVRIKVGSSGNRAGKITGITVLWDFCEDVRYDNDTNFVARSFTCDDADELLYGGAVTAAHNADKVYFKTDLDWDKTDSNGIVPLSDQVSDWVNIGKAQNVYTIQTVRDGNVSIKKGGSFNYIKQMFDNTGDYNFKYDGEDTGVRIGKDTFSDFVDYVFVREYDGRIKDVVIVKPPKKVAVKAN